MDRLTHYIIDSELETYQSIIQALPQSMFLMDKEKKIIGIFNATLETLAGIPIEEIVGKNILDFTTDPKAPFYDACIMLNDTFDSVFKTGVPLTFEYTILDSYFEATISKMPGDRILSQVREITDIVFKQRDIENQKHNELAISLMAGGLTTWRYDVRTGEISSTQGEILVNGDMPLAELFTRIIPEHRHKTQEMLDGIILHGDKHGHITIQLLNTNDQMQWSDIHAIPHEYDSDGNLMVIIGSHKNVTSEYDYNEQLKKMIDKNELILNNTSSGFVYLNPDLTVEWENVSSIFTTPEIVDFFRTGKVCCNDNTQHTLCCKENIIEAIGTGSKTSTKLTSSDGVIAEMIIQPVFNDDKQLRGIVLRIDDITEQERTLHELALSKEQAEQSDKLKSAFLANMSHEIRTPLNSIVGFAQLIPEAEDPEQQQKYIDVIGSNSEMLLNLINDILDLSKIEAGYFTRNDTIFNLPELYTELETIFRYKMHEGIDLVCSIPTNNYQVKLDRIRISQLISNFMTNAIKFTQKGHIKMGFDLVPQGIKLYVEDTGCGMTEHEASRVFGRFEKFNKFVQGTGLGTSIAKAIVDAYDGEIGVETAQGTGSTFWAILPVNIDATQPKITFDTTENQSQVTVREKTSSRILVAEDNDSNYMLIRALLKGYDLTRACNGLEAVDFVSHQKFDLILMDIRMPGMDGIEATQRIRETNKRIPIIAVTANAFDEDRKSALDAGVNDFLTKPLNKKALLETIASY